MLLETTEEELKRCRSGLELTDHWILRAETVVIQTDDYVQELKDRKLWLERHIGYLEEVHRKQAELRETD
jgi:hypothetical protein